MDTKELNKIERDREEKLNKLKEAGFNYPNDFNKAEDIGDIVQAHGSLSKEDLEKAAIQVSTAGRVILKREMGKVVFMTIEDTSGSVQGYFSKNNFDDEIENIKTLDVGDIVGVSGQLFRTRTDELTIEAKHYQLLTKSLKPMPDKHKGLQDIETIYRQRYIDLMSNKDSRDIFIKTFIPEGS